MDRLARARLFLALSAVALAISLLRRDDVPGPRWESYVGEIDETPDAFFRLGLLDARVWLGISLGLLVAALIVALRRP